jgi:hypothetical protein
MWAANIFDSEKNFKMLGPINENTKTDESINY